VTGDRIADYLLGSAPGTGASQIVVVSGATGAALSSQLAFDPLFSLGVYIDVN
jgi:hypothetical protein